MTESSSRRIEATQRSAAEYLKVPVDDLKRFFPATSVGFWRDFKFEGQTWAAVQGAFDDARKQRQLVRKAGISHKDDWQPMDCKKALEILKAKTTKDESVPASASHKTSPVTDLPEPCHEPKPAPHDDKASPVIDLTNQPESNRQTSVLQLQEPFTIFSESLSTLQPGEWLNGQIVNGTLLLLKEVSSNKVQVVDSGNQTTGIDFHKTKVLLPMLIRGNHWVLGVYDDSTLLVYDSNPTQTTETEARRSLARFLQEDAQDILITVTSPLLQKNLDDCGVFTIIAAFHETIGPVIKPAEIDPAFWRDFLRQLLSPQPDAEHVPLEPELETRVDLSGLPANARLSEVPGIVSQFIHKLSTSTPQRHALNGIKRKLALAERMLEIAHRARELATKAGLPDAVARFQRVEDYYTRVAGRCRGELESKQWIDRLLRMLPEGTPHCTPKRKRQDEAGLCLAAPQAFPGLASV